MCNLFKPYHNILLFAVIIMLASCASGPAPRQGKVAVAVWDIDNLTPSASEQPDLGELLSAEIIRTIQEKAGYTVVERERLLLALEELHLGSASLADESTRLRLGRISGAGLMVFGGYQVIGGRMRLDLRLVDVETGRVKKAVHKTAAAEDLPAWLRIAGEAAGELFSTVP
ncbi:MAG: hypothetical protein GXP46_12210 [Deferribacteres bacterium]|nr:hypothetical protein [Deferribacteres bacterium]